MIGASHEVIEHHAKQHVAQCGQHGAIERVCPCGATTVICCRGCHDVVFVCTDPNRRPCWHARPYLPAAS